MKKLFRRRLKCSDSALAREERQAVSKEKRAENNVVKNRVEENSVRMLRSLRSERARILGASRVKRFSQVKRVQLLHSQQSERAQMLRTSRVARILSLLWGMLLSVALLVVLCLNVQPQIASAKPAGGHLARPSKSLFMLLPSFKGYVLGVIGVSENGDYLYCHQWGVDSTWTFSNSRQIPDSPQTRSMGYLLERYHNSSNPLDHAALATLIHDHFDLDSSRPQWNASRARVMSDAPGVEQRATELWAEGTSHAVAGTEVTMAYSQAKRRGRVSVRVTNASGESLNNVPVTVRLHGPAHFESNNSDSITVTSATDPVDVPWVATGEGEVSTSQSVSVQTLDDVDSAQNFVRLGDNHEAVFQGIRFDVRKVFQPEIRTQVPSLIDEAGNAMSDSVQVGVMSGDAWEKGVTLKATGYAYTGLTHEKVAQLSADEKIQVRDGEKAADYIARLRELGLESVGTEQIEFTDAGQTRDVHSSVITDEESKFTTWVWTIARDEQGEDADGKDARQWMDKDAISGLLDVKESTSTRQHVSVDSTVSEHSAELGAPLTDRITIAGFPDDHGEFTGNERFGWKADKRLATVRVYWSADKPDSVVAPADDDTHQLVGQFEYEARNGVLAVGGGKPDAHGEPVYIYADRLGYYAFVYGFAGDDRVMPVTSAWNDEWECTRVVKTPHSASIVTHVDKSEVMPGEDFADIARVEGTVSEGSTVSFTAYDAADSGGEMGATPVLIKEETVAITPDMRADDGSYEVRSPSVRSQTPGIVYWKATLRGADGTILASHGLGVAGEQTEIKPPPDTPKTPEKPSQPLARTGISLVRVAAAAATAMLAYGLLVAARTLWRLRHE